MYGGLYMKVKIGISNRHIHLSQTDANILFKENYQFKKRNDYEWNKECKGRPYDWNCKD